MSPPLSPHARTLAVVLALALGGGTAVALEVIPEDAPDATVRTAAVGEITAAPEPTPPAIAPDLLLREAERELERERLEARQQQLEAERAEAAAAQQAAERGATWDRLADCESGEWDGNARPIEGSRHWDYQGGFFQGGVQFHPNTWDGFRDPSMPGHAGQATREQQIAVAERVLDAQGWKAWPACSLKLGYR